MRRCMVYAAAAAIACLLMASLCLAGGVEIASYPYPSYLLQAQAWLEGRTYLTENIEYLELAVHEGRYYVSFPPVPSVPMVIWALIFGEDVPGGLLQKLYALTACMLVLSELMRTKRMPAKDCAAWAILLCFGCAMLPVTMVGGVWYEAQILAFLFSVAAVIALRRKKVTLACLCYALAVGCRPFSVLLGPVLLMIYLKMSRKLSVKKRIRKLAPGLMTGLCVAAAYGAYNYARFGSIFEFGHNYLPEFLRAEHGQLSFHYLADNLKDFLFGSPVHFEHGRPELSTFGFSLFLSCPVFICSFVWVIRDMIRRRFTVVKAVILLMWVLNVVLLCMHRTLGGYQFGARYALEMLPLSFCYLLLSPDKKRLEGWEAALMIFGLILNFAGGSLVHA